MPEPELTEGTLPSLDAVLPEQSGEWQLLLTLAFHPDTRRIGESVRLDVGRHCLGRDQPGFATGSGDSPRPLLDRHVSRRTLVLDYDGQRLRIARQPAACRCRIGGRELTDAWEMPAQQLQRGVPLLISHAVLLWIAVVPGAAGPAATPDYGLVGNSHYMQSLRRQIAAAAQSDLDLLLLGPTGTGKDRVATAVHEHSARSGRPMVAVNLAAVPASLAPAALFGAARGAFTGADRARKGYFQEADGGTLFLDEIGDAPAEVQPQLLRALQQREVQVVGGAAQTVDLRVIAATDAPLTECNTGFKSALRHRLGALEIRLLPLREHPGDIGPLLREGLTDAFRREGRAQLLPGPDSDAQTLSCWSALFHACVDYAWPGNVRELLNLCNQLAVASETGLVVTPGILERFGPGLSSPVSEAAQRGVSEPQQGPARRIAEVTEEEFAEAWHSHDYEVRTVARNLGVSRQAVYRKVAASDRYRLAADVPDAELLSAMRRCDNNPLAAAQLLEVSPSGLRARLRQGQPGERVRP